MKVKPFDGATRFHVESEKEPGKDYLVDLLENNCFGKCGCWHFEYRIQPQVTAGFKQPELYCKHLVAARDFFTNQILKAYAKENSPKGEPGQG